VSKHPRRAIQLAVYGVSVALHAALATGAVLAPQMKRAEAISISLSEVKKAPPKPADPAATPDVPPPQPVTPIRAKAVAATATAVDSKPTTNPLAETAPSSAGASDAFADLGLVMGNGGGMAVPVGRRAADEAAPRETTRKVAVLASPRSDACEEPVVKARLRGALVKPVYTDEARGAQIEGVVRVEMTVDEQGNVVAVRVLKRLGYGLDDAAERAARQMTFEPGTRCGKATVTKLTVGMRFSLQQ
jgi:protein TonB